MRCGIRSAGTYCRYISSGLEEQIKVVNHTLKDLGVSEKPLIIVFNKIDAFSYTVKMNDLTPIVKDNIPCLILKKPGCLLIKSQDRFISAKTKET